ncbi:type II secretion system protein GspM [uncultured Hydrogenophaga sp.]|uniref:type II secretion system protein GspM n=1 Tax=uncultured Hydrogenophaga sp. TaxID=199683 RepID=UPI00265DE0BD|nr:type II secretion system protein GspM [uncultured Hydrogenophaga sp.]
MNAWMSIIGPLREEAQTRLAALSARERRMLAAMAVVLLIGLLLAVAVLPAWRTLAAAPAQQQELDARMARMQQLAATAADLKDSGAAQAPAPAEVQRALETATSRLSAASRVSITAGQATLTVRDAEPAALAAWIEQARINARLTPVNAELRRGDDGRWNGTLVLGGPVSGGN